MQFGKLLRRSRVQPAAMGSSSSKRTGAPSAGRTTKSGASSANKNKRKRSVIRSSDVCVSCAEADAKIAQKVCKLLSDAGLSAELHMGDKQHLGASVIGAGSFVLLLTKAGAKSKRCKDDVALAYINNKPIFPAYLEGDITTLGDAVDFGMKLILAPLPSYSLGSRSDLSGVPDLIASLTDEKKTKGGGHSTVGGGVAHGGKEAGDFWKRNFSASTEEVKWEDFEGKMRSDFKKGFADFCPGPMATTEVLTQVRERLGVDKKEGMLTHKAYRAVMLNYSNASLGEQRKQSKERTFWDVVQLIATENAAVEKVFDVDSTVRLDAIEQLAAFQSPSVVAALSRLLLDEDANVRAVAAVSLGRVHRNTGGGGSGGGSEEGGGAGSGSGSSASSAASSAAAMTQAEGRLVKCLSDGDRLVRESACLALCNLKSKAGIPGIVNLWRNDAISSVRAAALLSLEGIGGPEAMEAMQLTRVLTNEIAELSAAFKHDD